MPLVPRITWNFFDIPVNIPVLSIDFANRSEIQYFVGEFTEEILFVGQENE